MLNITVKILVMTVTFSAFCVNFSTSKTTYEMIDRAVKKWAPLVVFHPDEKYFPLSVEEYLEFVNPVHSNGTVIKNDLPIGRSSHGVHLTTKSSLDSLKSRTSFLNGKNPEKFSVPSYIIVNECRKSTFKSSENRHIAFTAAYWFFFPYNEGKEVCFFGTKIPVPYFFNKCVLGKTKKIGDHVGDFEHITISFDFDYNPVDLFASTHDIGAYYSYIPRKKMFYYKDQKRRNSLLKNIDFPSEVSIDRKSGSRPLLYAAKGSHGLWGSRGRQRYHKLPNLYDYTESGVKWKTWENIQIYHIGYTRQPDWMQFIGKWGNPKDGCLFGLCELSDAPKGIVDRPADLKC